MLSALRRNFALAAACLLLAVLCGCASADDGTHVRKAWEVNVTSFREALSDDRGNSYILSGAHVTRMLAVAPDGRTRWKWEDLNSPPQYTDMSLTDQGLLLTLSGMEAALLDLNGLLQWRATMRPWETEKYSPNGSTAWFVLPDWNGVSGIDRDGKFLWFNGTVKTATQPVPGPTTALARDGKPKQSVVLDAKGQEILRLPDNNHVARFIDAPHNRNLLGEGELVRLGPNGEVLWRHQLANPDGLRWGRGALVLPSGTFVEETKEGELRALGPDHQLLWTKSFSHSVHSLYALDAESGVGERFIAAWMDPPSKGLPAVEGELHVACIDAAGREMWSEGTGVRNRGMPQLECSGNQLYAMKILPEYRDQQMKFSVTCLELAP